MASAPQTDLFGNPVATTPVDNPPPRGETRGPVNDMDLAQAVLADIASDTTAPLHLDGFDLVRRCAGRTTEPVSDEEAAVVEQLLAARYLTTRRDPCTGHGPVLAPTRDGRNAVHRWAAYRRPSTWPEPSDPCGEEAV